LIIKLAQKENLTETQAASIITIIFKNFTDTLTSGGRIEIRGFGSFVVRNYAAYDGRNPKTGQGIKVAPKKLPFFKVGKELKDGVNSMK